MFPSDTEFDTKVTLETEAMPIADETPFHILLLGDWSGRESLQTDSTLRPVEIDRDNFDEVMKRLRVGLDLNFGEENGASVLSLKFTEIEDFHPDNIFQKLPLFADLRDVRRKLTKAETFNEAAREVRSWLKNDDVKPNSAEQQQRAPENTLSASGNLLDQILGQSGSDAPAVQKPRTDVSSELSHFVNKLVKPHLVQTDVEEQSKLLLFVDEVASDLMRKILHHPHFQALESAWRGVHLLVRKAETDFFLKIFLLDITKKEISANLKSVNDLNDAQLYRTLSVSDESWAMICGNYTFELNVDDIAVLIRLAKIGSNLNAPFISGVYPEMFGFRNFDTVPPSDSWRFAEAENEGKLWNALRSLPEADFLGLALPRFLARLPYGEKTEPIEAFYFEEFGSTVKHDQHLWANGVFICALLLAQSFRASGWKLSQNLFQNLDGLPVYFYSEDGQTKTKPCAEVTMTQSNCEKLIEQGLIPLISFRDTDRIRIGRFQSVGFSESMLSGRWDQLK